MRRTRAARSSARHWGRSRKGNAPGWTPPCALQRRLLLLLVAVPSQRRRRQEGNAAADRLARLCCRCLEHRLPFPCANKLHYLHT